jgi:AhpD family alkylhydroperoxidase
VCRLKRLLIAAALVAGAACLPHDASAQAGGRGAPIAPPASIALAPENAAVFANLGGAGLDDPATGRVPNYLRALAATYPDAAPAFARLVRTVLYGGTVAPETKAAMGLLIARETGSGYLSAHMTRLLKATERGQTLLHSVSGGPTATEKERIALRYGVDLTRAIHGVSDAEFAQARAVYNDAQLVELTAATCFFNYFARFCQGAGLPLEPWAKAAPNALPPPAPEENIARVTLASDAELQMAVKLAAPSPELKRGLGIGIANSQRAMLRVPDIGDAWFGYWQVLRPATKLPRETQLQISFAVSMANGCRYCTLHQVVGLRRLGVDPAKLQAMKRDDTVLTPRERAAVIFARKLTKTPGVVRGSDYAALRAGLGDDTEAMDALLQTCAFNFMNRFTDGLRLPSEEEAIRVYQEVYGEGSYRAFPRGQKTSRVARP